MPNPFVEPSARASTGFVINVRAGVPPKFASLNLAGKRSALKTNTGLPIRWSSAALLGHTPQVEPQVRYCVTPDGVQIAFTVTGKGPLLVWAPDLPNSHVQLEWTQPGIREQLVALSALFTVVRFDARGVGLSDRDATDLGLQFRLFDLTAVLGQVRKRTDPYALMGIEWSGPLVITHAARHPTEVSHLVLLDTFAAGAEFANHPRSQISMDLLERDWDMFIDSRISLAIGLGLREAGAYANFYRQCVTQEVARRMFHQLAADDATSLLGQVEAPTLILRHSNLKARTDSATRTLATRIPVAELVTLEGGYFDQIPSMVATITRFIQGTAPEMGAGTTAVIMFIDIVDSTSITERIGDSAFRERAHRLDESLRRVIRTAAGTPVEGKLLGDGVLAVFTSASQAIDAGVRCAAVGDEVDLQLHLGIHAGDVIREGDNVFGGAVNLASRISDLSAPGEVLVSDVVRGLARTSTTVTFEDRGEHMMKGISEPQRVFAVRSRS